MPRQSPKQKLRRFAAWLTCSGLLSVIALSWLQDSGNARSWAERARFAPCRGEPSQAPGVRASLTMGARPWGVEASGTSVWVLTRDFAQPEESTIARLDSGRGVVTSRLSLGFDPWDLAVGSGSLWVAPNGGDGRLVRVNSQATRITARISGGRIPLTNFVAAGEGSVWTGTDERFAQGRSVPEIDPRRNALVGRPVITASDIQGLAFGFGSVWVADHSAALITRIDAKTRRIVARIHVPDSPHGLAVGGGSVWVALWHIGKVIEIDPDTDTVVGAPIDLDFAPVPMAADDRSVWIAQAGFNQGAASSSLIRLDRRTRIVLQRIRIRDLISDIELYRGVLWVAAAQPSRLLKIC